MDDGLGHSVEVVNGPGLGQLEPDFQGDIGALPQPSFGVGVGVGLVLTVAGYLLYRAAEKRDLI